MAATLALAALLTTATFPPAEFPEYPGWTCLPESTVYTPSNLWDLIDGAADLFLEYRFEDLRLARYVNASGIEVRVEIYRHGTATDAFGMYAAERSTDYRFIDVGTQGYRARGIVNAFCGAYYVKVSTMDTADAAESALIGIARRVADHLAQPCAWPAELRRLPAEGRITNSEQFVRRGLLGHEFLVNAFSAGYAGGGRCFYISRTSAHEAAKLVSAYRKAVRDDVAMRPDGSVEVHDPYNGTVLVRQVGAEVVGVYGTTDPKLRESLLAAALNALK